MTIVDKLVAKKLLHPPKWLSDNVQYLVIMGSEAYGVSSGASDVDVYGWCIPPKHVIFPHLNGYIPGFGQQPEAFEQFQQAHIIDPENSKEYDFSIYNIIKYFQLVMQNNPNMIDSLFVPERCVLHCSEVARMVRDRRKEFLHKGSWHKFKGYAYSQLAKIKSKDAPTGKRKELVEEFGFDVKFAYHVVRLIAEVEQIMMEGDLDLERNREQLKAIRRGEWTLEQITEHFTRKEVELETLYLNSSLPHSPNEDVIKQLLMDCLEHHYGSLGKAVVIPNAEKKVLEDIENLISKYRDRVIE